MSGKWTTEDLPDLSGCTALVTGANSGIGLVAARELAGAGADVLLGCRDPEKGARALTAIKGAYPDAAVEVLGLDLADLSLIEGAARRVLERRGSLDLLVNNAGVMAVPRIETADGFELQLGTNHLGHFALAGRLLDLLRGTARSRVVALARTL